MIKADCTLVANAARARLFRPEAEGLTIVRGTFGHPGSRQRRSPQEPVQLG